MLIFLYCLSHLKQKIHFFLLWCTLSRDRPILLLHYVTLPPSLWNGSVGSRRKSQLSQITQRFSHLFSLPLSTTPGKNLRIRGAVLDPNTMTLSTCVHACVCECVRYRTEVLQWGQTIAPVGLTPSGARMSARFRGQGCNQTAGRLPRLLSSSGVDAVMCVCALFGGMTEGCLVYLYICESVYVSLYSLFPLNSIYLLSSSHLVSSPASWTPSCLCLASIMRRDCLDAKMIAIGFEQ